MNTQPANTAASKKLLVSRDVGQTLMKVENWILIMAINELMSSDYFVFLHSPNIIRAVASAWRVSIAKSKNLYVPMREFTIATTEIALEASRHTHWMRLNLQWVRKSPKSIVTSSKLSFPTLQRDFEKLNAKRNLAPTICRIPLQKSISTPSIAPVQNAKEENNVP